MKAAAALNWYADQHGRLTARAERAEASCVMALRDGDALAVQLARLRAVLAEPSEEEARRLADVADVTDVAWPAGRWMTHEGMVRAIRAVLADLRRRAGVDDV